MSSKPIITGMKPSTTAINMPLIDESFILTSHNTFRLTSIYDWFKHELDENENGPIKTFIDPTVRDVLYRLDIILDDMPSSVQRDLCIVLEHYFGKKTKERLQFEFEELEKERERLKQINYLFD